MQQCNVSQYAFGLCFCLLVLIFSRPSLCCYKLTLAAKPFLSTMRFLLGFTGMTRGNLRHGLDIDCSILNGRGLAMEWTLALLDAGQIAHLSAADCDPLTSHLAAFGVKR